MGGGLGGGGRPRSQVGNRAEHLLPESVSQSRGLDEHARLSLWRSRTARYRAEPSHGPCRQLGIAQSGSATATSARCSDSHPNPSSVSPTPPRLFGAFPLRTWAISPVVLMRAPCRVDPPACTQLALPWSRNTPERSLCNFGPESVEVMPTQNCRTRANCGRSQPKSLHPSP